MNRIHKDARQGRSSAHKTTKVSKASKKAAGPARPKAAATAHAGTQAEDEWQDEGAATPARSRSRSRESRVSDRVDTPTAERTAYFGPGASSTDLVLRAPRRNRSLAALDLATNPEHSPLVVPPLNTHRAGGQNVAVERMVMKAGWVNDGRMVDALGRSYVAGAFDRATLMSRGGMLLSFDEVQPQAYWAKRIDVPEGEALPNDLRREVELNVRSGSPAAVHRILRTPESFYLLMPYMMGDALTLFGELRDLAATPGSSPAAKDHVFDLKRVFAAEMLESLAEAHGRGILHRDVKLENFAYHDQTVALIDFGSAHEARDRKASPALVPGQMAPDHMFEPGPHDAAKGDVYAAGVSVFTLLTGDNFLRPAVEAYAASIPPPPPGDDLAAAARRTGDVAIVERVKAQYAEAWPLMRAAAVALQAAQPRLVGKFGDELRAEVDAIVDVPALASQLAAFSLNWATSVPMLLRRDPLGALAILDAVAPTDAQRSTARQAADAYAAAVAPTRAARQRDLGAVAAQLSAPAVRAAKAKAERLIAETKARLASPAPYFDELQLENQPQVGSMEEAKAYIQRLKTEAAPTIPVLEDHAGGTDRIRELYVKLK